MSAIETVYDGYRFRSRTEARWAVFFNALGIRYEYEKEGYDLPQGIRYLPDFWLPDLDCWVEIKGEEIDDEVRLKAISLCIETRKNLFLFLGAPWFSIAHRSFIFTEQKFENPSGPVLGYIPRVYFPCEVGSVIVEPTGWDFEGHRMFGRVFSWDIVNDQPVLVASMNSNGSINSGYSAVRPHPLVERAYHTARQARFEFGETPDTL